MNTPLGPSEHSQAGGPARTGEAREERAAAGWVPPGPAGACPPEPARPKGRHRGMWRGELAPARRARVRRLGLQVCFQGLWQGPHIEDTGGQRSSCTRGGRDWGGREGWRGGQVALGRATWGAAPSEHSQGPARAVGMYRVVPGGPQRKGQAPERTSRPGDLVLRAGLSLGPGSTLRALPPSSLDRKEVGEEPSLEAGRGPSVSPVPSRELTTKREATPLCSEPPAPGGGHGLQRRWAP